MDSLLLRSLIEVQSEQTRRTSEDALTPLTVPERTVPRTYPGAPQKDSSIELQRIPQTDEQAPGAVPPDTDDVDIEMSRPSSPVSSANVVEVVPSVWDPYMNRFRLLAVCLANFGNALSDGAAGAIIPYMEK